MAPPTTAPPPAQTLYLQNLAEKIPKADLKRALYMLFTPYGPVLDVNALRSTKMRGQAHVLFRDTRAATLAMRECQGMDFFGKEMKISYAKSRSHTLAKLTGTFYEEKSATATTKPAEPTGSFPAPPTGALPPPPGLPQRPSGALPPPPGLETPAAGSKRGREESDEEDVAAGEDSEDEGGEMEMSDED